VCARETKRERKECVYVCVSLCVRVQKGVSECAEMCVCVRERERNRMVFTSRTHSPKYGSTSELDTALHCSTQQHTAA